MTVQSIQSRRIIADGDFIDAENRTTVSGAEIELAEVPDFAGLADEPPIDNGLSARLESERASDEQGPQTIDDARLLLSQILPDFEFGLQYLQTAWCNSGVGQEKSSQQKCYVTFICRKHGSLPKNIQQRHCYEGATWKEAIDAAEAATLAIRGIA